MGYTMHQIQKRYNDIVNNYKSMMFVEVPCSSVVSYSLYGIYRITDLKSVVKESLTARIKLVSKHSKDSRNFPIYSLDLDVDQFIDGNKVTANYGRFYYISSNYYTTDLSEVTRANEVHRKRYIDNHMRNSHTYYLDLSRLSNRTKEFLIGNVCNVMDESNRSHDFKLIDVYFRYNECSRKLVASIKHSDSKYTESIQFDTKN